MAAIDRQPLPAEAKGIIPVDRGPKPIGIVAGKVVFQISGGCDTDEDGNVIRDCAVSICPTSINYSRDDILFVNSWKDTIGELSKEEELKRINMLREKHKTINRK